MFQKLILIGNLGQDPIIRHTQSGMAVANMSLATNETRTVDGEKKKFTEWHRLVAWGKLAEMISEMAASYKKGKQLFVEGRLRTRSWEDKDDVTRYTTEVMVTSCRLLGAAPAGAPPVDAYDDLGNGNASAPESAPTQSQFSDDIPF